MAEIIPAVTLAAILISICVSIWLGAINLTLQHIARVLERIERG